MSNRLTIEAYSKFVEHTALKNQKLSHEKRLRIAAYGFLTQVGTLVAEINRQRRNRPDANVVDTESDHRSVPKVHVSRDDLEKVIGDAFWYLIYLYSLREDCAELPRYGIVHSAALMSKSMMEDPKIGDVFKGKISRQEAVAEFFDWFNSRDYSDAACTFDDAYDLLSRTARTASNHLKDVCAVRLVQIASKILTITMPEAERDFSNQAREADVDEFDLSVLANSPDLYRLVSVAFWHLSVVSKELINDLAKIEDASGSDASLDAILRQSMKRNRYVSTIARRVPRDEAWSDKGRLPQEMQVAFVPTSEHHAAMFFAGQELGDELTDNSHEVDGYRFHDILHLANLAYLSWSPVMRSLLRKKRKEEYLIHKETASEVQRNVDSVEDGARAKIVEELMLKYLHSEAERGVFITTIDPATERYFPEIASIPSTVIRNVRMFSKGLEVESVSENVWALAIKDGFEKFAELRVNRGGIVGFSPDEQGLTFNNYIGAYLDNPVQRNVGHKSASLSPTSTPDNDYKLAVKSAFADSFPDPEIVKKHLEALEIMALDKSQHIRDLTFGYQGYLAYRFSCLTARDDVGRARYGCDGVKDAIVAFRVDMVEHSEDRFAVTVASLSAPTRN